MSLAFSFGEPRSIEDTPPTPKERDRILSESRNGAFRSIVAIGESYLKEQGIKALYQSLITPDLPSRYAIFVAAYPDSATEDAMEDGQPFEGLPFTAWRTTLLRLRRDHPWRAVRIISTRDGVVIQKAEKGQFTSTVLSGQDPTRFHSDGSQYELLRAKLQTELRGGPLLSAYIRAKPMPDLKGAESLTEAVRTRLLDRRVFVSIRPDVWFVYDSFPVWFPFCPQQNPPAWAEFNRAKEIVCNNAYLPMRCSYATMPVSPRLRSGQDPAEVR